MKSINNSLTDLRYHGAQYECVAPDTLDLAERAQLALGAVCRFIDPDVSYHMFFHVFYHYQTPYIEHHNADYTCDPKFAEVIPLLRIMCGSREHMDIEVGQRAELLSRIEDGLYWRFYDPQRPWEARYSVLDKPATEDVASPFATGLMLRAILRWRELTGRSDWDDTIHNLVKGLNRIAIHKGDYSYYPYGVCEPFAYPRSGWPNTDEPKSEVEGGEGAVTCYQASQIHALTSWYAVSGDSQSLKLATRLARFSMLAKFWGGLADPHGDRQGLPANIPARMPDPPCIAGAEQGHWYSHHHARSMTLRALLDYARVTGDQRVLEFVRRAYEYTLSLAMVRTGWLNTRPAVTNLCEGCSLGDMVALGIRLTDAGAGDYWDDVDALVRNHLIEQQLLRGDLLEKVAEASPARDAGSHNPAPKAESSENVIARSLGLFAGFSSPVSVPRPWVMQCCTSNCSRGLYYAWEGAVREDAEVTEVNLLLNRAAATLDVDSYLPFEGKVTIRNKAARRISVRIPSWIKRNDIRTDICGTLRTPVWIANRLLFENLKPGDTITVTFPIQQSHTSYTVASGIANKEKIYHCTFRGSTVVEISPRDKEATSYPLYLRDHLRQEKAPLKTVRRFVSDAQIRNW